MYGMVFKINQNTTMRKQANVCAYLVSIITNMLIFLRSTYIGLLGINVVRLNSTVIVVLFGIMGGIVFQFVLCLIYKFEFYLGIQFKIIRYVIFPHGLMYLFGNGNGLCIGLAIGLVFLVIGMTIVFESESYSEGLLHQQRLPLSSYFIVVQVLFYILQFTQTRTLIMLISSLMAITSIIIKTNFYMDSLNDHF